MVLLVESNPAEATLALAALAQCEVGALVVPDAAAARDVLKRQRKVELVIIFGREAAVDPPVSVPVVRIEERPREWQAYLALLKKLLAERGITPAGSSPRPGRTS